MVTISIAPISQVIQSDLLIPKRRRSLNTLKVSFSHPKKVTKNCQVPNSILVGGFDPCEKYSSKWESSLSRGEHKKLLKPPPSIYCIQHPFKAVNFTQLSPDSTCRGLFFTILDHLRTFVKNLLQILVPCFCCRLLYGSVIQSGPRMQL